MRETTAVVDLARKNNSPAPLASVLLYGIVGFAGLTFGWLFAILLAHTLQVPAGRYPAGVVGWVVLHHYSKRQELVLYLASLAVTAAAVATTFVCWQWLSARLASRGISEARSRWTIALGFVPSIALFLAALPYGNVLFDKFLLPEDVLLAVGVQAVLLAVGLWAVRRGRPLEAAPASAFDDPKIEIPSGPNLGILGDPAVFWSAASVLLAAGSWALVFPYLFSAASLAEGAERTRYLWPIAVALVAVLIVRRLLVRSKLPLSEAVRLAVLPALPSVLLWVAPFFWLSLQAREIIFGIAAVVTLASVIAVLAFGRRLSPPPTWSIGLWCVLVLAAYTAVSRFLGNPTMIHGAGVSPLDGEQVLSWMKDGTLGRVPFRDFDYPYGPLLYYFQLMFVEAFSLDSFATAYSAAQAFIYMLLSGCVLGFMLRWRQSVMLFVFPLYLISLENIRVGLGCVAIALALVGLERLSRALLFLAGSALVTSLLYSPEVGIAAFVTVAALLLVDALHAGTRTVVRHAAANAGWVVGGALAVAIPALAIAGVAHAFLPWIRINGQFLKFVTACCGSPFPPLFSAPELNEATGGALSWLLGTAVLHDYYAGPRLVSYYGGPLIVSIAAAVLIGRIFAARKWDRDDFALAAMAFFAVVMFQSALGRSDPGHVDFAMLPVFFIAIVLAERAAGTSLASAWCAIGGALHRGAGRRLVLAAQAFALAAFSGVVLFGILRIQDRLLWSQVSFTGFAQILNFYDVARFGNMRRMPTPRGFQAVTSADGQLYFFKDADTAPVVKYLASHLGVRDTLVSLPFLARYPPLLGRPSAIRWGQDFWNGGALPAWRRTIVQDLDRVRPRYVVYSEASVPDFDGVPWMDRMPEIADYVMDNYHVVKRIGATLVLQRGSESPPRVIDVGSLLAMPYLRRGWYDPESGALGSYRWTAQEASARLTQTPADTVLDVDVIVRLGFALSEPRTLSVSLDGATVLRKDLGMLESSITAPQVAERLRIPIPGVARPTVRDVELSVDKARPGATDNRILGVQVVRLGFGRSFERSNGGIQP